MEIITGKLQSAQKVVNYGPEGIGKTTFASKFPKPLFIDTEGSTKHMDVSRMQKPSSWTMLLEQVKYVRDNPSVCKTLVIDTVDWAEQLCISELCDEHQKSGVEDFGYGKGYVYLAEKFQKLLGLLDEVIEKGIHIVVNAHAKMRKFEQPDEIGSYDRWELKLQKHTAPLIKEWADMVLFANYKTYVIDADGQGTEKGKNKVQGGKRIMYTSHHPCWDAKNRHGLKEELDFDYSSIAHCISDFEASKPNKKKQTEKPKQENLKQESKTKQESKPAPADIDFSLFEEVDEEPPEITDADIPPDTPKELADLMKKDRVTAKEIQEVVADKGYYPPDTPISKYVPEFITGWIVVNWTKIHELIKKNRFPF